VVEPMRYGNRQGALFEPDRTSSDAARDNLVLEQVDNETAEPEINEKWSSRATLIFIFVACGLAWAAIITAFVLALRLGD
jgi:hypothetical protein